MIYRLSPAQPEVKQPMNARTISMETASTTLVGAQPSLGERGSAMVRGTEAFLLSGAGIIGAHYLAPHDPLLLNQPFPWLAFVPLLSGIQHGFIAALFSGACLGVAAQWSGADVGESSLGYWLLGCLSIGLVAGQFRDRIAERLGKSSREATEHRASLSALQQRFHLLERAYTELRAEQAAGGASVLEATAATEAAILRTQNVDEAVEHAFELLALRGRIESACFFAARRGAVQGPAVARLGSPTDVSADHPLVALAAREQRLVSVVVDDYLRIQDRSVVAAVPVATPAGVLVGVIAIQHLPMTALDARHLTYVHTLASCLASALHVVVARSRMQSLADWVREGEPQLQGSLVGQRSRDSSVEAAVGASRRPQLGAGG